MADSCLTPDIWKNWERQGKTTFMKTCEQIVKSSGSGSPVLSQNADNLELLRSIYDLLSRGIKGQLRKESVVNALKEIMGLHHDMPSMLMDLINVLDIETTVAENLEDRQRFCGIIKDSEKIFSERLMKERLEIDTLQEIGTLKNKNFYTKFIKVKTKLYYKQRKFNLFREESEGFAKLIVDLNQEISDNVTVKNIHEVIISLIGFFYLDPNRVLDIILESFECSQYNYDFFIPLLRAYMPNPKTLCEVLGFKYRHFQENETTPESLYLVTAYMIQHGIIAIDDIYSWLTPLDRAMTKQFQRDLQDAKDYEKKLNVISTKGENGEEPAEEKDTAGAAQEKYAANQKFGLCEALLKIGDWSHAEQLLQKLPDHFLMEQPPIYRALCKLLHSLIDPVYRKNCRIAPKIVGLVIPPINNPLAPKQAQTFDDLCGYVLPMLLALGSSLSDDPCLMYKVLRLCKAILSQIDINSQSNYPSNSNYYSVINLLDHVILPSLSFMECNCCIAEEVWNVLKLLPYQVRYCLYARWKSETYLSNAKLLRKRAEAQKKIKSIMKRVSKENIKPVGRHLGKLSHCAPGFLFDYVLLQIQIYDNLINPVVDSLKYLTSLSYDVLGYCLVESLTSADRDRVKHDGTSISLWLQSLASFSGAIFKKYNIELTGLLQYVCNQLKAEKSLDLLILKEIVQKMAGIEAAEEMTMDQLEAMAGGDILKGEGGYFSQVRNTKKSSQRLKDSLSEDNLAVSLCLLIAQQRYCVAYKETENSHLKLVGKLYDQCQDTLVQFGAFLASTLTMDEYVTKLPTIHNMLAEYHIHTDVAFFLARPMFTHAINLKYDSLRKTDPNWKKLTLSAKHQKYCEAASEVMSPIVTSVRPLHPLKVWEDISPQFLVTFWSLTMYDLFVPTESYQRETNKMKALALQAIDGKDMGGSSSKGKKEQERYSALVDKLLDEKKKQTEHVEKVVARLRQEKDSWFLLRSAKSAKNETITQFLQLCLFPRCIYTSTDALYCAKFVKTIHGLKTANFSTLLCYDRLFCDVTYSVTSCTENEANRYGRFLCAMLSTVMNWHASKELFDKECANYPGFVTKYRVSNQFSEASDQVGYENYRHVVHKWHYKITKAMVVCLDSKDYVQIRNGLIVLIKILPHFPVLSKLNQIIERKIEKVRDEEKNKRQDLYILATSYSGQLKAKTPMIIKEYDFHQVSEKAAALQMLKQDQENAAKTDTAATAAQTTTTKQVNGEVRQEKDISRKDGKETSSKEIKTEKRTSSRQSENKTVPTKTNSASSSDGKRDTTPGSASKEKQDKDKSKDKDCEPKEKLAKKDERRDEAEREKRTKDKKEDKLAQREESRTMRDERAYRDERGGYPDMLLMKDERYYVGAPGSGHPYHPSRSDAMPEERDLSSLSNSSSGSHRHSQEPPEAVRVVKRRKVESGMSSSKSSKVEERRQQQLLLLEQMGPNTNAEKEVKEKRSSKNKEKREKITMVEDDKEQRKERRQSRKRERAETPMQLAEKRRKSEEKNLKTPNHQNGEPLGEHSQREKHHYLREKSPYAHDRSHDREGRDKHRRSGGETKRR